MQKSIFQFTLKPPEQCAFPGGNPFRISWFYAGTFLIGRDTRRKDFFSTRLAAAQSGKASSVSWEQVRNALERAEITL